MAPKKGETVDGYTFMGGDPNDQANWKPVEKTLAEPAGGSAQQVPVESETPAYQPTVKEALLPRTTRPGPKLLLAGKEQPTGLGETANQAAKVGLDLLSLPGRAFASAPTLLPGGETFKQSMHRTGPLENPKDASGLGRAVAENILRDPALLLSLPIGGMAGKLGRASYKTLAARGALEGAASAGIHAMDAGTSGKKADPVKAGAEIALSTALPLLGADVLHYAQEAVNEGRKVFEPAVNAGYHLLTSGTLPATAARQGYRSTVFNDTSHEKPVK
jgi:hypothetical protein